MNRLGTWRVWLEQGIYNMFALDDQYVNEHLGDTGTGDAGVFVCVDPTQADMTGSPLVAKSSNPYYNGNAVVKNMGVNPYWTNKRKIKPAVAGDTFLGITAYQTAKYSDNGENLHTEQKILDGNCAVLPGQSVPVYSTGCQVSIMVTALDVTDPTNPGILAGDYIGLSTVPGKGTKVATKADAVAVVRATGVTNDANKTPYFVIQIL